MSHKKKIIIGCLKYALAFAALAYVFTHVELGDVMGYLKQVSWWYLVPSFIALNAAQYYGALRLKAYAGTVDLHFSDKKIVMLHYVGLFFNFILPGGIGGDAYKGYILKRGHDIRLKRVLQLLLSDRASGLYMLCLMLFLSAFFVEWRLSPALVIGGIVGLMLVLTIGYFVSIRLLLAEGWRVALKTMPYSLGVQAFSLLSFTVLWMAMGNHDYLIGYIILYQLAAIVAVVPISVGGLGLREFTFFHGALYMQHLSDHQLDPKFGIALSLCVYGMMVTSSLIGLLFWGKMGKLRGQDREVHHASTDDARG